MDFEKEKLLYRMFKKGRENLTTFDNLLLAANPEIKKELSRLYNTEKENLYKECKYSMDKARKEVIDQGKNKTKGRINIIIPIVIPAAMTACLLILFLFLFKPQPHHMSLGGHVSLFITNMANPGRFYENETPFLPADELQLAFQPPVDVDKIRQGVIFSVADSTDVHIYFQYDSTRDQLNQQERTVVAERLKIDGESTYIFFVAYFSGNPFNEEELIQSITKIIHREKTGADKILINKYKTDAIDFIYLRRSVD